MAPVKTSPEGVRKKRDVSAIMRRVRSAGTAPEILFRRALRERGLRYKIAPSNLPGKPDLLLSSQRIAVFIDGDFWHGGQWRRRNLPALEDQFRRTPSKAYWLRKIRRNMARDCASTAALQKEGWTVLRFWESQIEKDPQGCVDLTERAAERGAAPGPSSLLPQKSFAEFFAGIGLMRIGLERRGWAASFANDIDSRKQTMYRARFPDADRRFLLGDVHKIPIRIIPSATLATASFPCNDLSLAGPRKGLEGRQSSAFWGFIRVLNGMKRRRPPLVLLENVPGFLTSHRGADFHEALLALNRLGYRVDAFILDAARFVPQSRRRIFVIGLLEYPLEEREEPRKIEVEESDLRPKGLADFIRTRSEIRWRIRPLPAPPQGEGRLESILEDLPESAPEWWSADRAKEALRQMSPRRRARAEEMIAGKGWRYAAAFRRTRQGKPMVELRDDGLAGCLRTSRGGSSRQMIVKAGKGKFFVRLLTPRECARLMGADDYPITAPVNQALFGFGDAVCVPVIEWIAEYYLNPLVNELIRGRPLGSV